MTVRRACCFCQTPLDGGGAIAESSEVSHGVCDGCAASEHAKIDEMPTCGFSGKCDLFAGHEGACQELDVREAGQ